MEPVFDYKKLGLIVALRKAIMRQEGRPDTDLNPGDVRDPVWFPGTPPTVVGFPNRPVSHRKYYDGSLVQYRLLGNNEPMWVPRSQEEGLAAIDCQIAIHVREGDLLSEFIGGSEHYPGYAPSSDGNQVETYVKNLVDWTGITSDVPMWNFLC